MLKQEFGTAKTYGGGSICYGNAFIAPSTKVLGLHAICQTINLSSTGLKVHTPLFYLSGSALFAQTKSIFSERTIRTYLYIALWKIPLVLKGFITLYIFSFFFRF